MTEAGDKAAIILVFVFPPKAFFKRYVSLDSLYGTRIYSLFFFIPAFLARALMTLPKIERDLLIMAPSASLSPVAPVEPALSEPAKSIRLISEVLVLSYFPDSLSINCYVKLIVVTV